MPRHSPSDQMKRALQTLKHHPYHGEVADKDLRKLLAEAKVDENTWHALQDRALIIVRHEPVTLSGGRTVRVVTGYVINRRAQA